MTTRKSSKIDPELVNEYRDLADEVNKRLRELEKLSKKKAYDKVLKFSYARIQEDIKARGWKRKRINKGKASMPKTEKEIKGAINDMKDFLSKPTSTQEGIERVYEHNAEVFNNETDSNFTWQEMKVFMDDNLWKHIYDSYGSATAMKAYATLFKQPRDKNKSDKETLKDIVEKEKILTDDIVVQNAINSIYEWLNKEHEHVEWYD